MTNTGRDVLFSEIKRLVLAKGIYRHGCWHAMNKDEISRILAVHHFDFAVEIVLRCLATKYKVLKSPRQELTFKKLWEEIVKKGAILPLEEQIFMVKCITS